MLQSDTGRKDPVLLGFDALQAKMMYSASVEKLPEI